MCIVQRAQQRLLLIVAAVLANGTLLHQLAIELVTVLETCRTHSGWWANAFNRLLRIGNNEWAVLAAKEASGVKRLQFFSFTQIKTLADIDECRDGGIQWSECAGDEGTNMRCGDRLR